MFDAVCLTSGGLDSVVCLHLLRKQGARTLPLFINYGQRNLKNEFNSLRYNLKSANFAKLEVIDISGFGRSIRTGLTDPKKKVYEDAFTPNRNLIFLTVAASVAFTRGISFIVLGFLSEETAIFPDQSDQFLAVAEEAIAVSLGARMRIVCPLRDMTKRDVLSLAEAMNIRRYYSCHKGTAKPCGRCIACLEYT
jgi:7-cyano-7-deazaguanine synthase